MSKKKRIVIALGGNALGNTLPEQMAAVKITARAIVDLIEEADLYGDGEIRTETDINDYLWFYMADDLEEAGFLNEDHEWIEDDDEEEEDEND